MARKFFGTDGIRGRTNAGVMTAATAMKVGQAAGRHFLRGDHRHRPLLGAAHGDVIAGERAQGAGQVIVDVDVPAVGDRLCAQRRHPGFKGALQQPVP